jgi:hypothetical protein
MMTAGPFSSTAVTWSHVRLAENVPATSPALTTVTLTRPVFSMYDVMLGVRVHAAHVTALP